MSQQKYANGTRIVAEVMNHGVKYEATGTVVSFDRDNNEYYVQLDEPITRFGGKLNAATFEADEILREAKPWD